MSTASKQVGAESLRSFLLGHLTECPLSLNLAVAPAYMVKENPTSRMDGAFVRASTPVCETYEVQWVRAQSLERAIPFTSC